MYAYTDYVLNGTGYGEVASRLQGCHYDPGMMRPFIGKDGRPKVVVNTGKVKYDDKGKPQIVYKTVDIETLRRQGIYNPVWNTTSLRHESWREIDKVVLGAARDRLRATADLAAAGTLSVPGMSRMTLEYEVMSDAGEAVVDMSPVTEGRRDSPLFNIRSIPLPITHSDFFFDSRQIAVSRASGTPLDTAMAEQAGRRVAEMIEQTVIGTITGVTYGTQSYHTGTSSIYGYTNFPQRIVKEDMTAPTGTNPASTVADVLEMRSLLYTAKHYGPYMLYHSTDWDAFLDNDYYITSTGAPFSTLRDRLRNIEGIRDVRRLDYLDSTNHPFTMLMMQMSSNVARLIVGLPLTVVQWETHGGMMQHFKVMTIQVPQLRYDYNGLTGIVEATVAA